jgi:GTP-binding protein HflX
VALVGYTNAGKSTLMNALLELGCVPDQNIEEKKVFEKDMLFATLDTTVREISISGHQPFLLSDTVGFVDRLPHLLVEAFHSTLEEAAEADLLLQVVDDSDPHAQEQIEVTNKTLKDLGVEEIPMILIYNKADINRGQENLPILKQIGEEQHCIYLSAKEKTGLKELLDLMEQILSSEYADCIFLIPYQEGTITSYLNEHAVVRETEYLPEGIRISVHCLRTDQQRYSRYLAETL